ncbi:ankyrin and armadillo repeat-containing protein-like isoform X2 [Clavelina lepadiformis]|uniref:ankyrin and armadillo repeat-containing protein-like isoform X2 n=1 Tax=Clavelina lepadiformis TaxID=159417 RepID=UPI004042BD28
MSTLRPHSAVAAQELTPPSGLKLDLPSTAPTLSSRLTSPRPASAGLTTARSSLSSTSPRQLSDTTSHRDAVSYLDAFNKEELRELLAQSTASWLLSTDFRGQSSLPCGLISNLFLTQASHMTLLFPKEDGVPELEYRELHQIVRELTSGIFGANQMPSLCLEPNFDLSTTCQLPVAYKGTKVGQVLLSVDYAMKSLWHGVHVTKSKRSKLAERWRTLLDVSSTTGDFNSGKSCISEFKTAGQEYMTANEDLKHVYEELNSVDPSESSAEKETKFFNAYSEYVRCVMSMYISEVKFSSVENVIAFEASYDINACVALPDDDFISPNAAQRLNRRLRLQMKMIREGLSLDATTRRNIALLRFITATSLILVSFRRRLNKIPELNSLLAPLQSDTLRTDAELPPFAIGQRGEHPCETFTLDRSGDRRSLTHCHGEIQFDVDTGDIMSLPDGDWCQNVHNAAKEHFNQLYQQRAKPEYKVPTTVLDGKEHYVLWVPLTTYYPATPPIPSWLHSRYQVMSSMRPRKLPMNDLQLTEMFKQVFGFRKALANKSIAASLKLCAQRGLVAPFIALMKKIASSSLLSPDLQGFTLLHHACVHNKASILSLLLSQKPNLSTRRSQIDPRSTGPTALMLAARCGALKCVTPLLVSRAIPFLSDVKGWSAIHHAVASDQTPIIRSLLRRHPNLLEIPATGSDNATPLLVAASSGSLLSLQFLIRQGASVKSRDVFGDGPVERAALNFHADVLKYFIDVFDVEGGVLKMWDVLVEMLKSPSIIRHDASLRCLEVLLHHNASYWRPLKAARAVVPLVKLLQSSRRRPKSAIPAQDLNYQVCADNTSIPTVRSLACSVICLMSEHDDVRMEVAESGAIPTLIALLQPTVVKTTKEEPLDGDVESKKERYELQSRSSVVLSDLAHVSNNALRIADHGGIRPLVALLHTDVVDVLVNAVTTLASLCRGDRSGVGRIQKRIMEYGAASYLVDFLHVRDDGLQTSTADAIAAICDGNEENQDEFVNIGVLPALVAILRGHCISAQMKAALAVDCVTSGNAHSQQQASLDGASDALCRLFQIWSETVKERGACALWSLAGDHPEQQRAIAQQIGSKQLIDMLLSKSPALQLIGCRTVAAWSRNRASCQMTLVEDGTMPPLVRLLRLDRTSREVVMAIIEAINNMCIGVAHLNNKKAQREIAEEGAIELLLDRVWRSSCDETMQVELLHSLACVVAGCSENEEKLNKLGNFGFEILLEFLNSYDIHVKFRASTALALFAFNRLPQQERIARAGGIDDVIFESLLQSRDGRIRAGAAFQLVVLARVVAHTSVVDASARGIIALADLLDGEESDVIIATANYLASLAHTRAGVPDAIVTFDAVGKLLRHLRSTNDQVRAASSQALGYLSFNRTASREMMTSCRGQKGLYEMLVENLGEDGKISEEFVAEFKRQSSIGLPIPKQRHSRPQTALTKSRKKNARPQSRARSLSPGPRVLVTEAAKPVT